jgi:hypothetical protein
VLFTISFKNILTLCSFKIFNVNVNNNDNRNVPKFSDLSLIAYPKSGFNNVNKIRVSFIQLMML